MQDSSNNTNFDTAVSTVVASVPSDIGTVATVDIVTSDTTNISEQLLLNIPIINIESEHLVINVGSKVISDTGRPKRKRNESNKCSIIEDNIESDLDYNPDSPDNIDDTDSDETFQPPSTSKQGKKTSTARKPRKVSLKSHCPKKKTCTENRGSSQSGCSNESGGNQQATTIGAVHNSVSQTGGSTSPPTIDDVTNSDSADIVISADRPEKLKYTKCSRRKSRNVDNRFTNKNKRLRNSGEQHQYKIRGDTERVINRKARQIGPPCTCKNKCFEKVGEETIKTIFKQFWALKDFDLQTANLVSKMETCEIKRRKVSHEESKRSVNFKYKLKKLGVDEPITVCKGAFISIHGISKDRPYFAWKKRSGVGTVGKDLRGRHPNHKKISKEKINFVHTHIQSLPVVSSHYTRAKNPNLKYIDCPALGKQQVTIAELYDRYVQWMKTDIGKPEEIVDRAYYTRLFSTHYNIGIKPPQKDVCDTCTTFKVKIAEAKAGKRLETLTEQKKEHEKRAKEAIDTMQDAKEKKNGILITGLALLWIYNKHNWFQN